jgi:hypothetical protein
MSSLLDLSVKATRIHTIRGQAPALSKKGSRVMSQRVVLGLLMWIFALIYFNNWMINFSTSAMPGPHLINGIIFGVAESFSCLTSGLIVRYVKDSSAIIFCSLVCSVSATVFYFTGGMETGVFGVILLFT